MNTLNSILVKTVENKEELAEEVKKGILRAKEYVEYDRPLAHIVIGELMLVSFVLGLWIAGIVSVLVGDNMKHMLVIFIAGIFLAVLIFKWFAKLMTTSLIAQKTILYIFSLTWAGLIAYTAKAFGADWITTMVVGGATFLIARYVHFSGLKILEDGY